jgi:hypothetical protein
MYRYVTNSSQISDLKNATENAVKDWEDSTGQNLWDFVGEVKVNSGGVLVNNIRWSDDFGNETGYDPSRTLAVAIRYNNGSIFTKTEIILNGNHSNLRNNVNGMLLNTVMHELGHTIGLDHTDQYAIMAAYANDLRELQYDDIEGGNYVYSQHIHRQRTGGIQMLNGGGGDDSFSQIAACGSVAVDSTRGGPGARGGFIVSLLIGVFLVLLSGYGHNGSSLKQHTI